jgi:hypothetical protein
MSYEVPQYKRQIGILSNRSLEMIDLSDNFLGTEAHGALICEYVRVKGEERDNELWEISLRSRQVEKLFKVLVENAIQMQLQNAVNGQGAKHISSSKNVK